jgi:putative sigma-54 modulation protein
VFLKVENNADKANKTAEIILAVPGDDIVVKTSASFEESLDLCVDTAKKLLIKKKEMA